MNDLLKDPWVQVFALLTLVSGLFTGYSYLQRTSRSALWRSPAGGAASAKKSPAASADPEDIAAADAASDGGIRETPLMTANELFSESPSRDGANGSASSPPAAAAFPGAPRPPKASGSPATMSGGSPFPVAAQPKVQPTIKGAGVCAISGGPKSGEGWLVDAKRASDADSASLADVLLCAKDGQTIRVRPGVYKADLVVTSNVKITGLAKKGEPVRLEVSKPMSLSAASVEMRGLTLVLKPKAKASKGGITLTVTGGPSFYAPVHIYAMQIAKGAVKLEDFRLESPGNGVSLNGSLTALRSRFSAKRSAFSAMNDASLTLRSCTVKAEDAIGVLLAGAGVKGEFVKTRFSGKGTGVQVIGGASATITDSRFEGFQRSAIYIQKGSTVKAKKCKYVRVARQIQRQAQGGRVGAGGGRPGATWNRNTQWNKDIFRRRKN